MTTLDQLSNKKLVLIDTEGRSQRDRDLSAQLAAYGRAADRVRLRGFTFLSLKPVLAVVNVDESAIGEDPFVDQRWAAWLDGKGTGCTSVCATLEQEISELEPDDAAAFMADLAIADRALDRVARESYRLLGLISFFTVGEDEVQRDDASPSGTTYEAAFRRHVRNAGGRAICREATVAAESPVTRVLAHGKKLWVTRLRTILSPEKMDRDFVLKADGTFNQRTGKRYRAPGAIGSGVFRVTIGEHTFACLRIWELNDNCP